MSSHCKAPPLKANLLLLTNADNSTDIHYLCFFVKSFFILGRKSEGVLGGEPQEKEWESQVKGWELQVKGVKSQVKKLISQIKAWNRQVIGSKITNKIATPAS